MKSSAADSGGRDAPSGEKIRAIELGTERHALIVAFGSGHGTVRIDARESRGGLSVTRKREVAMAIFAWDVLRLTAGWAAEVLTGWARVATGKRKKDANVRSYREQ